MARKTEASLLDAAAAAGAVDAIFLSDAIDVSAITPEMRTAFEFAYPNIALKSLKRLSSDQLDGFISGWKGKYFEVLVRDRLNAGERIGDLHLHAGQVARLATSPTQPGWDLIIEGPHAEAIRHLQLKATQPLGYIKRALEKYPHVEILATDDVASFFHEVLPSGIDSRELMERVRAPLEMLFDSPIQNLAEDVLPFLPFVLILVGESRQVMVGRKTFHDAATGAVSRTLKTSAAIGTGALVALMDGGLLSVPTAYLARLGATRVETNVRLVRSVRRRTMTLGALRGVYSAQS
jgi:hypothetical protein